MRLAIAGALCAAILIFALVAVCWKDLTVLRRQSAASASSHYPEVVVDAFLAAEDPGFRSRPHPGPRAFFRSITNLFANNLRYDARTLLQQVVRMNLRQDRAWSWACRNIMVSIAADFLIPRERVINMYLDEAYLGTVNRRPLYGVRAGAQTYFHKTPEQLDVSEAATLAAMLPRPNYFSPILHPGRVEKRRDMVLRLICEHQFSSCSRVSTSGSRSEVLR